MLGFQKQRTKQCIPPHALKQQESIQLKEKQSKLLTKPHPPLSPIHNIYINLQLESIFNLPEFFDFLTFTSVNSHFLNPFYLVERAHSDPTATTYLAGPQPTYSKAMGRGLFSSSR